jgi:hypothetical protein
VKSNPRHLWRNHLNTNSTDSRVRHKGDILPPCSGVVYSLLLFSCWAYSIFYSEYLSIIFYMMYERCVVAFPARLKYVQCLVSLLAANDRCPWGHFLIFHFHEKRNNITRRCQSHIALDDLKTVFIYHSLYDTPSILQSLPSEVRSYRAHWAQLAQILGANIRVFGRKYKSILIGRLWRE